MGNERAAKILPEVPVPQASDGYASASKFVGVGDDEAVLIYYQYIFFSYWVRIQELLILLGELAASTELGRGGRYTSTLLAAELLASAFTVGGRRSRPDI